MLSRKSKMDLLSVLIFSKTGQIIDWNFSSHPSILLMIIFDRETNPLKHLGFLLSKLRLASLWHQQHLLKKLS